MEEQSTAALGRLNFRVLKGSRDRRISTPQQRTRGLCAFADREETDVIQRGKFRYTFLRWARAVLCASTASASAAMIMLSIAGQIGSGLIPSQSSPANA